MALRKIIKALLLWLACTVVIALWISGGSWGEYNELARRGVATRGIVEKKEPDNHAQVRYFYEVEGQRYSGIGRAGFGNPPFDQINPGDRVLVFYDPEHPSDSCLGTPRLLKRSESRGVVAGAAFAAAMVVLSIYVSLGRSRKAAAR